MTRRRSKEQLREDRLREALELVAAELRHGNGLLKHGDLLEGKLIVDELDVEVSLRVRNATTRDQHKAWREAALERIYSNHWFDCCNKTVRDRGSWTRGRTKGCSKPIVAVIVSSHYGTDTFDFRCQIHLDDRAGIDERKIKAVLTLSSAELAATRERRKRDNEERALFNRMTEVERIARDAELEGRAGDAAQILKAQGGQ